MGGHRGRVFYQEGDVYMEVELRDCGQDEDDICEEAERLLRRPGRSQFSALVRSWKGRPFSG